VWVSNYLPLTRHQQGLGSALLAQWATTAPAPTAAAEAPVPGAEHDDDGAGSDPADDDEDALAAGRRGLHHAIVAWCRRPGV
jgi:hypothetical protein